MSERAHLYLATLIATDSRDHLALDDVDGWLRGIERTNRYLIERFAGFELPIDVEDTQIAWARVRAASPRGI